jgi:hypothetical protein
VSRRHWIRSFHGVEFLYFNISEAGTITWLILFVAILLEILATRLKRAQHVQR